MSRWGSQMPQEGRKLTYGRETPKRAKYLSPRVSFLTGGRADDIHHEPPVYELIERRIFKMGDELPTSHDVHALIHERRLRLFGDVRDRQARDGQLSMMDEEESDRYEELIKSQDKIKQVDQMIMMKRRKYGLG